MRLIAQIETRDGLTVTLDRLDGIVAVSCNGFDFQVEAIELQAALDALAPHGGSDLKPAADRAAQQRQDAAFEASKCANAIAAYDEEDEDPIWVETVKEQQAAARAAVAMAKAKEETLRKQIADLQAQLEAALDEPNNDNSGFALDCGPTPPHTAPLTATPYDDEIPTPPQSKAEQMMRENMGALAGREIGPDGNYISPRYSMRAKPSPDRKVPRKPGILRGV